MVYSYNTIIFRTSNKTNKYSNKKLNTYNAMQCNTNNRDANCKERIKPYDVLTKKGAPFILNISEKNKCRIRHYIYVIFVDSSLKIDVHKLCR